MVFAIIAEMIIDTACWRAIIDPSACGATCERLFLGGDTDIWKLFCISFDLSPVCFNLLKWLYERVGCETAFLRGLSFGARLCHAVTALLISEAVALC